VIAFKFATAVAPDPVPVNVTFGGTIQFELPVPTVMVVTFPPDTAAVAVGVAYAIAEPDPRVTKRGDVYSVVSPVPKTPAVLEVPHIHSVPSALITPKCAGPPESCVAPPNPLPNIPPAHCHKNP
jgi:hypothetical protein